MDNLPENYNINDYDRPSVAVDTVVFTIRKKACETYRHLSEASLSVLLIKRNEKPFKDFLSLAGGFASRNETIEETAQRKLFEKTGVKNAPLSLLKNFSAPNRDPRGWIISCGYWTVVEYNSVNITDNAEWYDIKLNEENSVLELISDKGNNIKIKFRMNEKTSLYNEAVKIEILENSEIAFDHAEIIIRAVLQLRKSLDYPYAVFRMLPELFTLTELQKIYEVILDTPMIMANFRRKIMPYVEESTQMVTGAGHRPSKLFKASKKL